MEHGCIPFSEVPHTSALFLAFLQDFGRVSKYFAWPPNLDGAAAAARKIQIDPATRQQVSHALREQNLAFAAGSTGNGLDPKVAQNLERLAGGAVAVVTGQQAGIFGGPAYALYKALAAVRCADELTLGGIEAVPVFWLATEDHDFAEVSEVTLPTRDGLERFRLAAPEGSESRSVGEVLLGDGITAAAERAERALSGPYAGEIGRMLRECYTQQETFGSAFGKLLSRLLAGKGMLFIDPLHAGLQRLLTPLYAHALESSATLRERLAARSKELEGAGFHSQVRTAPDGTLLFLGMAGGANGSANGRREPVHERDGVFAAGDRRFSRAELRALAEKAPGSFTPNVLLRPLAQDTLLPTAAYIGGPSEVAYFAQASVVYEELGARMPAILPRPSFTLIEAGTARVLAKYGLDVPDVWRGKQGVRQQMERNTVPDGLARKFEAGEAALHTIFAGLESSLEGLDPTLASAAQNAERKALHQLLSLKAKAGRAEDFRSGVLDRHEKLLFEQLYPDHQPQERVHSLLPWLAAQGSELLEQLAALMAVPGGSSDAAALKGDAARGSLAAEMAAGPARARITGTQALAHARREKPESPAGTPGGCTQHHLVFL